MRKKSLSTVITSSSLSYFFSLPIFSILLSPPSLYSIYSIECVSVCVYVCMCMCVPMCSRCVGVRIWVFSTGQGCFYWQEERGSTHCFEENECESTSAGALPEVCLRAAFSCPPVREGCVWFLVHSLWCWFQVLML